MKEELVQESTPENLVLLQNSLKLYGNAVMSSNIPRYCDSILYIIRQSLSRLKLSNSVFSNNKLVDLTSSGWLAQSNIQITFTLYFHNFTYYSIVYLPWTNNQDG